MSVLDLMVDYCIELGKFSLPGIAGESPIIVNLRRLSYEPERCLEVLEGCVRHKKLNYFDVIFGIRNSGAIWGLSLALHATQQTGLDKKFIELVPEHIQEHVTQPGEETPLNREKVYVLFDDFVTTGFSIAECKKYCKSKKLPEDCIIPFTIFSYGIVEVNALVTLDDLLKRAKETGRLPEGEVNHILNWRAGLVTKE